MAFLELPRPSRSPVFMPLRLSSCSGVWTFTRLLLLGQAEVTIKSIKIWITSNRPVTNMVKNVIYWHQFTARANQEWHKGLMGLINKKYPSLVCTWHCSSWLHALQKPLHYFDSNQDSAGQHTNQHAKTQPRPCCQQRAAQGTSML